MFPLFRRDGQQPSNHRLESESAPPAEKSLEDLPPEAAEPEDSDLWLMPEEGDERGSEPNESGEHGADGRPANESNPPAGAGAESVVEPERFSSWRAQTWFLVILSNWIGLAGPATLSASAKN